MIKGKIMPKVEINQKAPQFSGTTFQGQEISLADLVSDQNLLLVFNRGFL
jgi:hypothetical protein